MIPKTLNNPRLDVVYDDWPMGFTDRGKCKFEVECKQVKRGTLYRILRSTSHDGNEWHEPRNTRYGNKCCIVDDAKGNVYGLQLNRHGLSITVYNFKLEIIGFAIKDTDEYHRLLALINQCYEENTDGT